MGRHVVAAVGEIPPGGRKLVTIRGREIGVFNLDGEFFALINRCPHQGAALCKGEVVSRLEAPLPGEYRLARQGAMLRCPWHCWEFDIRTGQSWCDPNDVKARTYHVTVEPGEDLAKGPFAAETVNVSVERDYVVVIL
jgi:3-phenylpropionate/trans-cinnamate dioxygenase ferredoxin subunit